MIGRGGCLPAPRPEGADLGCAQRARTEIPPWLRDRDPGEVGLERTAELERRVHGFVDAALG